MMVVAVRTAEAARRRAVLAHPTSTDLAAEPLRLSPSAAPLGAELHLYVGGRAARSLKGQHVGRGEIEIRVPFAAAGHARLQRLHLGTIEGRDNLASDHAGWQA
jgi:hypothetical protein